MRKNFLLMTFLIAIIGFCGTSLSAQNYVAKVGNYSYTSVIEAINAAIENQSPIVELLENSSEVMPSDVEFLLKADLTLKADSPVTAEFYNNGTTYDFIFNSSEKGGHTLTIGENVTFHLKDRTIWAGYYGDDVTIKVEGTLIAGYQFWCGAKTIVTETGILKSAGEALVLRRGTTLEVDGGKIEANYFSFLSGKVIAKNNATITSGPIWVANNGNYINEGNVELTLDNSTWTSSGNIKLESTHSDGVVLNVKNGAELSASSKEYGASVIGSSAVVNVDDAVLNVGTQVTNDGEINATNGAVINTPKDVTIGGNVNVDESSSLVPQGTVAKIGTQNFETFAAAISNANNDDEIILLDNVTDVDVTINKKVTLNLNEKTIYDAYIKIASDVTVENGSIKNVNESYPLVVNSGTLTVENVAIEASKSDRAIWLNNSGTTLNFNEGSSILATKGENNTKSKIYGVWVSQGATANINGGFITVDAGNNATAVAIFGNYVNTVNVNGGKISTSGTTYSYAIWTEGDITVTGGEIITNEKQYGYSSGITYGKNYAINTKGNVKISDGKFTTYGPYGYIVNAGGSNQEVKISGGEFENVLSEADKTAGGHSEPNLFYGSSVVATITGGDFEGYSATLIKGTNSTLTVSGGTFDRKINDEYLAEGFEISENVDGTFGVEENPTYGKVAKVGETYYTDLQEAIVAGGEVTILSDITLTEGVIVAADKTVILDLNGFNITVPEAEQHIYAIDNRGNLTLKDNSQSKGGSITSRGIISGYYDNSATTAKLTVESGKYYGIDNGGAAIFNGAELVIVGGEFYGYRCAVDNALATANTTINSGTFGGACLLNEQEPSYIVSTTYIIRNDEGTLTINDANVVSGFGAVGCYGGTTVIKDGDFLPTGWGGYTSHVVYVDAAANVTINGGTYKMNYPAGKAPDSGEAVASYYKGTLEINGGTFYAHYDNVSPVQLSEGSVIKGGSYYNHSGEAINHSYITNFVAEGYELKADGTVEYVEVAQPVASVNGVEYPSLQEAIVAAAPSGTVEIINDVTVDKWIMISERLSIGSGQIITIEEINGLTINGNNHTLTVNSIESASNGNRLFYDATNLNIKDLTINYKEGVVGGIGLTSGTIENVTFNGGVGVLPGEGNITIYRCNFNTSGSAIYNEEARDNLVVTGNTFNTAAGQYAIYLRGNTTFTDNIVIAGKVNVVSGSPVVSGNDFGTERFKVYNGATATIENNTINNLVFNDETVVASIFGINTLSKAAEAVLDAAISYVTLEYLVQNVIAGNGTYDGKDITVKVVPASGDARNAVDVNIPNRLQKYSNPEVYYAQYQRFGNLTDVNISNVNFVFVPKAITVVDAWNTSGATTTAENVNGELQLMNAGTVSFNGCSFDKMSVSPINATTLNVTSCEFNGLAAYAIKDVKANTTITGTTFTGCNGGFWFSNAPESITVTDNIFTGVGRRGAIQFSATGDYTNTAMNITGNKVTDDAALLWQLNTTVSNAQLSAILNNNEYTTAFVAGSIEPSLQGDGSETNPYLINNIDDLVWFRDQVNTYTSDKSNQFKGKFVKLTNDIDLEGINWTPIGTNTVGDHSAFLGTFYGEKADGTIPTISNLYINADSDHLGFFARVGNFGDESCTPTIKNIKFNNVDVSSNTTNGHGGSYVAGIIANAGGNSVISNIEVTGDVYVVGYGYIGGIVGHGYPDIDNCHVRANEGSYIQSHYWCCGGIIGYAGEDGTPITNSSVSGVKILARSGGAAAIAGLLQDGNKIENVSASNVEITSNNDYCMGYIAGNGEGSTLTEISIENVTATANGNPITATDAVAQIGDNIYFDLADALNAAQEDETITVLRDVTLAETLKVTADQTLTLDLNGKTIDGTEKVRIAIMSYGNLTVKDSSEEQLGTIKAGVGTAGNTVNICAGTFTFESGNIYSKNNAILIDEQAATVNIKGGNITAEPTTNNSAVFYISSTSETTVNIEAGEMTGYNGVLLWNNTTLNITGGTINATGNTAIQGNGMYDNTEINISGENTSISGYYAAIYHPQGGELNISNGTLSGWTGVVVKGGTVNISGGTINGTGEANDYKPVSSGYVDTGDALYVEHFDNSTNSGNYGTPTVTVTGGTFNSTNAAPIASYANPNNAANDVEALVNFVSGGTFNGEIEQNLLAEGYELVPNEDGTYGVINDPNIIDNLAELIAFRDQVNAGNTYAGKTVTLATDIDLNNEEWTPIGTKNCPFKGTFDGQNHTISNLKINNDELEYAGFLGHTISATIKNVKIKNVDIYACDNVGAIAGDVYTGKVENCHVSGTINLVAQYAYAAGITGYGYVTVKDCSVIADVMGTIKVVEKTGAGGITGWRGEGGTGIYGCTVKNVNITAWSNVGGITGFLHYENTIDACTVDNVNLYKTREDGQASIGLAAGGWAEKANNAPYTITVKNTTFNNMSINGTAINSFKQNGERLIGSNYSSYINIPAENLVVEENEFGETITDNLSIVVTKETHLGYALASDENEVVNIGGNIVLAASLNITGKRIIDLNGYTISGTDNATANFGLINIQPGAELTINDSSDDATGKITLTATNNREWNAYSSVISNQRGKLTVNGGTIEHLGGTDMAYGIDNLTNGKGTYAETIINGGTIKSTYRAIRQFLNGEEAENILTVDGGTIEGTNKSIWMQDPSKNANTGTLTVGENVELKGDVYLFVTEGSTEWPVEISIAADALAEGSEVLTGNVPAGYDVQNVNGIYGVVRVVAQIGETKYQTLADAVAAAENNAIIQLIWAEGNAPIAMNANLFGKNITITGTATVDWNKNYLFVGRGGEGNATLTFDGANLTSASNSASYGIHVSGREKNTNNKYDGTLVIKNSTIELDYLINRGAITLDEGNLTVKNGFGIAGRPNFETESNEHATATISLTNNSKVVVNIHNGMGIGQAASILEGYGVMNIDATSSFETTMPFNISANGTLNNAGTVNINGALTNNGTINFTTETATLATTTNNLTVKLAFENSSAYKVVYENNTYSVVLIPVQEQHLVAGWNWYSSYLNIKSADLANALGTNATEIKGQTSEDGSMGYDEGYKCLTGSLTLDFAKMYMINTTQACDIKLAEDVLNPADHPVTLKVEWSWIGYPSNVSVSVNEAFDNLTPHEGDMIKTRNSGHAEYAWGTWVGTLKTMIPGEGYMYRNTADGEREFFYNVEATRGTVEANYTAEDNHWVPNVSEYPFNMTMTAVVDGMTDGNYEVAAFINGEVRGSARPIYVEAIDAYMLFLTINGDEVEEMSFRLYDIDTDTEYDLNDRFNYSNNAHLGSASEPYVFSRGTTGIGEASMSNVNIYPNPTTTGNEINLQATCDTVEVFNALGVKVAEYQNVDTIDALETAGIYVIRITNNGNVQNCRLVVK